MYLSTNPDEAMAAGVSASDIFIAPTGGGPTVQFAQGAQLGLDPAGANMDDVDALVMWDAGVVGRTDPGVDCALFSLSYGSASLGQPVPGGFPLNPGDIFFTDFNGSFALYATAAEVGLAASPFYPQEPGDNVDSLEVLCPGDANLDGLVNVGDLGILAANYGTPVGMTWFTGDFNATGGVNVGDLGILAANYGSGTGGLPDSSVPEPATICLIAVGAAALLRRRS